MIPVGVKGASTHRTRNVFITHLGFVHDFREKIILKIRMSLLFHRGGSRVRTG